MAEKDPGFNNTAEPASGTVPDEQLNLKKRARRRLVGAVALALLAVIVLPMVMDQEPKPITQDIQIRIPNQAPGTVAALSRPVPKPLPAPDKTVEPAPAPAAPVAAAVPEIKPEAAATIKTESSKAAAVPAPEKPAEPKAAGKAAEKPVKSPAQERKAESVRAAALLNGEQWVLQLGAYQDMANVKLLQGKIKELGYPSFTEKVDTPQGMRVRVRAGPFASREAAEKAQDRLKKISAGAPLGGVVAQK